MKKNKFYIVIILLSLAILTSYYLPKAKYVGTNFISNLEVPSEFAGWRGRDVSEALGINPAESTFNFINKAFAYEYVNSAGKNLLFIILDAGNFHHPEVCFTGAGFKIKNLPDTEFQLPDRTFKAKTLFTEKENATFLSFYWIVIDKNIAEEWVEQKLKQLYFSLFDKKRVGLMVRIDIPAKEGDIKNASAMARQFINDLDKTIKPVPADYIFGRE